MKTLSDMQREQSEWTAHNFPNKKPHHPLIGAMEELGELAHAHLKAEQGIRGTPEEHHAAKEDAIADVIIYLLDYCNQNGIELEETLWRVWEQVKQRDWRKDPMKGGTL
jgi:NTP pyrophosphatase (non-canonical NTP hydrolase)